ncbi:MAG: carboxypeptidase regulatory-like domain-containing protein [Planctomycetota bacterium]
MTRQLAITLVAGASLCLILVALAQRRDASESLVPVAGELEPRVGAQPRLHEPDPAPTPASAAEASDFRSRVEAEPQTPAPAPTTEVFGNVSDLSGEPISRAWIRVFSGNDEQTAVWTDDGGDYVTGPLDCGTYELEVSKDGYFPAYEPLTIEGGPARLERSFTLEHQQRIAVHLVRPDGRPTFPIDEGEVEDSPDTIDWWTAVPVASRTRFERDGFGVHGSPHARNRMGRFRPARDLSEDEVQGPTHFGDLQICERSPGWIGFVFQGEVLDQAPFDRSARSITLTIDVGSFEDQPSSLAGRVVDSVSGLALEARVTVEFIDKRSGTRKSLEAASDGATGAFGFDGIVPGVLNLSVRAPGCALHLDQVRLGRGEQRSLGTIALQQSASVAGRVVDVDGQPAKAQVYVGIRDPATDRITWHKEHRAATDADGRFRVEGLVAGPVSVRASEGSKWRTSATKSRAVAARATSDPSDSIVLELANASARVTLAQRWDGRPWPIARFVPGGRREDSVRSHVGLFSGEATVRLVPGDYELVVELEDRALQRREMRVEPGDTRLELGLEQP